MFATVDCHMILLTPLCKWAIYIQISFQQAISDDNVCRRNHKAIISSLCALPHNEPNDANENCINYNNKSLRNKIFP